MKNKAKMRNFYTPTRSSEMKIMKQSVGKMIKSHNEISTWYQKRIQIMLTLLIFVLRIEQKEGDWMKLEKDVTAYGYHELLRKIVMFLFISVV